MARARAMITAGLFTLAAGLMGCQQSKPAVMVDALPPPNFGGPILASPVLTPPPGGTSPNTDNAGKTAAKPTAPRGKAQAAPAVVAAGVPRDWVPSAATNSWRWIVIHHSATSVGGANRFDREHRAKKWDELGYHFVIGNGTDTGDGAVEVGSRWPKQKWGAHAKTPSEEFNKFGVGICLVGNFDQGRPSEAQLKSLAKLTAYLMKTYRIPPERIIGHGDTKATECPGRHVNLAVLRRMSTRVLAEAGETPFPTRTASAAGELLVDQRAK